MEEKFIFALLVVLLLFPVVKATNVTDCQTISSGGYYILINNINSITPSTNPQFCIYINANNVEFDLNNYVIYGKNSSIGYGINVNAKDNIIIRNGIVKNFTMAGLSFSCGGSSCDNNYITGVSLIDNFVGLTLTNVNNSNFQVAVDQPSTGQIGIQGIWIKNISLNAFSRAILFGGYFENISYSSVSGHYDKNIIVTTNQTTFGGNLLSFLTLGMLPPTVLASTHPQESQPRECFFWKR